MKPLLGILLFFSFIEVYSQQFNETTHDFGEVNVKEKQLFFKFNIYNNTPAPLIISSAYAHCSCIDAVWSKNPISVSDSGYVTIRYSILGSGYFKKSIKVSTNKGRYTLWVTGNVVKKKDD